MNSPDAISRLLRAGSVSAAAGLRPGRGAMPGAPHAGRAAGALSVPVTGGAAAWKRKA